jgi:hypothetical protein
MRGVLYHLVWHLVCHHHHHHHHHHLVRHWACRLQHQWHGMPAKGEWYSKWYSNWYHRRLVAMQSRTKSLHMVPQQGPEHALEHMLLMPAAAAAAEVLVALLVLVLLLLVLVLVEEEQEEQEE